MIHGVTLKELKTFYDNRGFVREILRSTDECYPGQFGQWNHTLMYADVVKAWHYHKKQADLWYVCGGVLLVGLYDLRENSPTRGETMELRMGDHHPPCLLAIPPEVAHGCRVLQGPVNLLYFLSHTYDPGDEYRIPHDDPRIGFDWMRGPPIK